MLARVIRTTHLGLPSPQAVRTGQTGTIPEISGDETLPGAPTFWRIDAEREAPSAHVLAPTVLSKAERERADAFHRQRDRDTYVVCHVLLRLVLARKLDVKPEDVEFVRETCPTCGGPHGRPALVQGKPHFSLSHSGMVGLIGVADNVIGVDVERTPKPEVATQTGHMLHPEEAAELAALSDEERPVGFGRIWTRKEAYLKALGTGLSRGLSRDYMGAGPVPAQRQPGWTLVDLTLFEGYFAAAAIANA